MVGYYSRLMASSLYGNAFYLMLNTIVTAITSFIFWNIMARYFSYTDVGIGVALTSASGLIATVSDFGLGYGLVRFIPEVREQAGSFNNAVFTISGLAAGVGAICYLSGIRLWSLSLVFVNKNTLLVFFFIFFTVVSVIYALLDFSFIAGRSASYLLWKNMVANVLRMPIPLLLIRLHGYGIFFGSGVASFAAVVLSWFWFLPAVFSGYCLRLAWRPNLIGQVLPFSLSNYFANLLSGATTYVYPLIVMNVLGPEQSAFFYIAWIIATSLMVIPFNITQSLFAEGSHNPHSLGRDGKRAFFVGLLLSLVIMLFFILIGKWLLHFFGRGYAENGTAVFYILLIAIIPNCINNYFIAVNQIRKRADLIMIQTCALAVLALGPGYWLLRVMGLDGVGIAYASAQFLVAAVVIWPLWKVFRQDARGEG